MSARRQKAYGMLFIGAALMFTMLSAVPARASNDGCDVLTISGARQVSLIADMTVTLDLGRSLGPEYRKKQAQQDAAFVASLEAQSFRAIARDVTSGELAQLRPDLRVVFIRTTGTFSATGEPLFAVYSTTADNIAVEESRLGTNGQRLYTAYSITPEAVKAGCSILAKEDPLPPESPERKQAEGLTWKPEKGFSDMGDGLSLSCQGKTCLTFEAPLGVQAHFLMEKLRLDSTSLANDHDDFSKLVFEVAESSWTEMRAIYCRRYPGAAYIELGKDDSQKTCSK